MRRKFPKEIPKPPDPEPTPSGKPNLSDMDKRMRLRFLEQMMVNGASEGKIVAFCKATWGVGRKRALRMAELVKARWVEEDERNRPIWKSWQIQRLMGDLSALRAIPVEKRNYAAISATERLLADVQGTKEPVKVDINVARVQAVDRVILELTPAQFDAAVASALEDKRLAERARTVLRLGDGTEVQEKPTVDPPSPPR